MGFDRLDREIDHADFGEREYPRGRRYGPGGRGRGMSPPPPAAAGPPIYGELDYDNPYKRPEPRQYYREVTYPAPPPDMGPRGPPVSLDGESRFGEVPYREVPPDVRRAYERKIGRSPPPVRGPPPPKPRLPKEDDRTYVMYPQGFAIQPAKYNSPPPSYRLSAQHAALRYPVDDPYPRDYERPSWQMM